jgi:ribonuclease BN (tRNA processing enzyme)
MTLWAARLLLSILMMSALAHPAARARLVILGSGTPIPEPRTWGPAVAVVVHGQAYLFDAGAGVVRRAEAAAEMHHLAALEAPNLTRLFLTHLHSDHTLGYPDLILTPWVVGRSQPLEVFGPKGTEAMTGLIKQAYHEDIAIRVEGLEQLSPAGLRVNVHEISEGIVYRDANITVRAIRVVHGSWAQAFGYAVDAGGRTIVISGDTTPSSALAEACHGCDVLVHEVYSAAASARLSASIQRYHASFHTSTTELARIASKAEPKLLVLYHQLYFGPREAVDLVKEIRQGYSGKVVDGRDLDIY